MKIAVLGNSQTSLSLVQAALANGRTSLTEIFEHGEHDDELRQLAPEALWRDQWESLLGVERPDVLIVASSPQMDLRAEQLRKLVQQAVPMLLIHPACEAIVGYELDMIRRDTGCLMATYYPGMLHPAIAQLAELVRYGLADPRRNVYVGKVEQLVLQRGMHDRRTGSIWSQLARDADIIRNIVGDIDQVSAMGAADREETSANLSVQMSSSEGVLVRWSVVPAVEREASTLLLLGSDGKAELSMPTDQSQWSLSIDQSDDSRSLTFPDYSGPAAAWEALAQQIQSRRPQPDWSDVCHSLEIAASTQHSLKRRRTILLHHEQHTEQQTFKGMMAAGGCGALVLALLGMIFAVVVDSLEPPFRDHVWWRLWPVYLLSLIGVFLLLQLLQLVFRSDSSDERAEAESYDAKSAK